MADLTAWLASARAKVEAADGGGVVGGVVGGEVGSVVGSVVGSGGGGVVGGGEMARLRRTGPRRGAGVGGAEVSEILTVERYDEITKAAGGPISYGEALMRLHAHDAALRASNAALTERIALDNAVCLCGCQAGDHEDLGEDGEQCGHEGHECLRVAPAVLAAMQAERASNAALRGALEESRQELALAVWAQPFHRIAVSDSDKVTFPIPWELTTHTDPVSRVTVLRVALARADEGEGKNNG